MHGSLSKILGMASWIVTGLAAVNTGLAAFGFDFFKLPFVQNNLSSLITPALWLILASGVVSLVMAFSALASGHCSCGCKN